MECQARLFWPGFFCALERDGLPFMPYDHRKPGAQPASPMLWSERGGERPEWGAVVGEGLREGPGVKPCVIASRLHACCAMP